MSEVDEDHFRQCFGNFSSYPLPESLVGPHYRPKIVQACARYHALHASGLFLKSERGMKVKIRDFDIVYNNAVQIQYDIKNEAQLSTDLGWPRTNAICPSRLDSNGAITSPTRPVGSCSPSTRRRSTTCRLQATPSIASSSCSVDKGTLQEDPRLRFVLVESSHYQAEKLNITRDMFFKILTYFQVCPLYLKLITAFSYKSRASDPHIGAIKCMKFFQSPGRYMVKLGRSGRHFSLTFQLTSFHHHQNLDQKDASWYMYRAAIYHDFDVANPRSLWIITNPQRVSRKDPSGHAHMDNCLWKEVESGIRTPLATSTNLKDRLTTTFDVLIALADCFWEDWAFYLHDINERVAHISGKYIDFDHRLQSVMVADLQKMNWCLFELSECKLHLEGNLTVLKRLKDFYGEELIPECTGCPLSECKDTIDNFVSNVNEAISDASSLLGKAVQMEVQAKSKESYMQKRLQNHMATEAQKEAAKMGIFQLMALIFLPVTVVSTVFSTDIVKFQSLDDGRMLSFSPAALWIWIATAVALTGGTFALSYWLMRKDAEKNRSEVEYLDSQSDLK